jgi:hypothetical protein
MSNQYHPPSPNGASGRSNVKSWASASVTMAESTRCDRPSGIDR